MYIIVVIICDIIYIYNIGVSYNVYKLVVIIVESFVLVMKSNCCVLLLYFKSSIILKIV